MLSAMTKVFIEKPGISRAFLWVCVKLLKSSAGVIHFLFCVAE